MKYMGVNEVRQKFLDFFAGKDHMVVPSFSLVPHNDKSLLLINAGMTPFKPYFTGQEKPPNVRMATCQKCIRTVDIDNVGKTARHGTFFEMLGNFSFGDYFKKEAIEWAWEFVTEVMEIPVEKLHASIYLDDDEAYTLWTDMIGLPPERVVRLGKEDNFWEHGTGPCGPSSEIFIDRGEKYGCGSPDCGVGCDCDRYMEFWNLVFTQFDKTESGEYLPLPNPNIDTGMGLERLALIMQGVDSIFELDTLRAVIDAIESKAGTTYGSGGDIDISIRVITDHIRSTVFMISDGILPSNEGRGYVLRRILRRAARHGKRLGIEDRFLAELVEVVVDSSAEAYPELREKKDHIQKIIDQEEKRFYITLDQGLSVLNEYIEELVGEKETVLCGLNVFTLYDTYGFPVELTQEILAEKDMKPDMEGFAAYMAQQRQRARSARKETDYMGAEDSTYKLIDTDIVTDFVGYGELETEAEVLAMVREDEVVDRIEKGDSAVLVLDKTPFYAESGGQIGDKGLLTGPSGHFQVEDTRKIQGGRWIHTGKVIEGSIQNGNYLKAQVDHERRLAIARNHTVTHLLHSALRAVLGDQVHQAGSLVTPDRLRFDFTQYEPMTAEQIERVERMVNNWIWASIPVDTRQMSMKEAQKEGATALFGEKYGDNVRVVSVGDVSMELCGGTHLSNTGQAGLFQIISESSTAAGVRRIEAVTGWAAYDIMESRKGLAAALQQELRTDEDTILDRVDALKEELRTANKELAALKAEMAKGAVDETLDQVRETGGVKWIATRLDGMDVQQLRESADRLRDKMKSGLVVLASALDKKVMFIAAATKDVVKQGIHAGNLVKELAAMTGGGGGGRPDMAQAGGRDVSKIDDALSQVGVAIEKQLGI